MHWTTAEMSREMALTFAKSRSALNGESVYIIRGPHQSRVTSARPSEEEYHSIVLPDGTVRDHVPSQWVGGWKHEDGTICPVFLAPVRNERLWCTEHQQHVTFPSAAVHVEFLHEFGHWINDPYAPGSYAECIDHAVDSARTLHTPHRIIVTLALIKPDGTVDIPE